MTQSLYMLGVRAYRTYLTQFTSRQELQHRMVSTHSKEFSLFEGKEHAKLYAKYRLSYPQNVYEKIHKFCKESDSKTLDLAIDVGCGTGQSTLPLTNMCKHVIGVDISTEQISEAKKTAGDIEFRVGVAEDLSFLGDGTVDLVTTATAIHWMDIPTFMGEVKRVLRPGGVLAVYSTLDHTIHNNAAHQMIWQDFGKNTLRGCWTQKRTHIKTGLSLIDLPFEESSRETMIVEQTVDIQNYIGYISSWSGWHTFLKKNPNTTALDELQQKLTSLYTDPLTGEVQQMSYTWPIALLLGRQPQN